MMPIMLMEHMDMYGIGKAILASVGVKAAIRLAMQKQISMLEAIKWGFMRLERIKSWRLVRIPMAKDYEKDI